MARVFKRKDRLSAMSEINITSLLDLVFCLLIIFMITTPLLEQAMPVKLPTQSRIPGQGSDPKLKYQAITMNAQGEYFYGRDPVTSDELLVKLKALAALPDPPTIDVRLAATLNVQQETDLLDLISKAGLTKISRATQVH